LVDQSVIAEIIAAINPQADEALIEIGPGLGAITQPLLVQSTQLSVIEFDRDLAARLRRRWPALDVIEADVLKVDFAALQHRLGKRLRVVGNLPYNISTPVLFHLAEVAALVQDQHFMLQREVVQRMVAQPDTSDYSRLSVMLQWRYEMESVLDVLPHAFDPPPRVDSAVVRMVPLAPDHNTQPDALQTLVTCAFSQRRKLLRHTLGKWLDAREAEAVASPHQAAFLRPSFDLQRRAQEVTVDEYVALAQACVSPISATQQKHFGMKGTD
jgi:16S rRNA (adenine1518-N6/adenine1519-N6)-dimethyltransferase